MRIDELLQRGGPTFSFEFFPTKTEAGQAELLATIRTLKDLAPDFVSVTFGAGGSTRDRTVDLTARIKSDVGLEPMAHLTCVGMSRDEVGALLQRHWDNGVRNIMALRGDPPDGKRVFTPTPQGFGFANELVEFIAKGSNPFCIGVAGYPEGHPECMNLRRDIEHLKAKVDAGAHFITTQLFFDNADFFRWRDLCRANGLHVPIVAGIMPILGVKQIKRFVSMCGSKIPYELLVKMETVEDDAAAVEKIGIDHAIRQCKALLAEGVDGIHFYTLNKSRATIDIVRRLLPWIKAARSEQD